ncbi:MAG: type II secretion system F family protein [Pseudomonadota bacterium]
MISGSDVVTQAAQKSETQTFNYVARDASGARKTGQLVAPSSRVVSERLRADGLFPVEVNVDDGTGGQASTLDMLLGRGGGLSQRKQSELVGRLATLTERRVPIDRALQVVADGDDKVLANAAAQTRKALREGAPFSTALEHQAEISDPAILSLIRGAEVSGDLSQALKTAADLLSQRLKVRRRILTGLMYPCLLLIVAVISLGLIMVAIIPQFRPLVEDRMDLVPPLGRAIFAFSGMLEATWPFVVTGIVLGGLAIWYLARTGRGAAVLSAAMRRLPLVGQVLRRNQIMMMLQTLGALLGRGVILSQALRVTVDTAPAAGGLKAKLGEALTMVESGDRLTSAFRSTRLLTTSSLEVVRIGEESGDLGLMVSKAADDLREEADRDLERFLALFQPALIILVGLMIGVSLYALFSAIVSVNAISL